MQSLTPESNTSKNQEVWDEGSSNALLERFLRSIARDWTIAPAFLILLGLILSAVLAPILSPHDPYAVDMSIGHIPPVFISGGNPQYLLGTDSLGRDVFSRLIYGGRISLLVGVTTVLLGGIVGLILGVLAGYYGGWVDNLIMRLADAQLAFPFILLIIAVIAVLGSNLRNLIIVLAASSWVHYARLARAEVLTVIRLDYIEAARAIGSTNRRIILRHVLPNVVNSIIILATVSVAQMILAESALSYLGLGVQLPTPTWGSMLNEARQYLSFNPWLSIIPGFAIMLTVLSVNILGDLLRDLWDPQQQTQKLN